MKIALGTAQLGMKYGAFSKGQQNINQIQLLLKFCLENDIHCIDTAYSYGDSEKILGSIDCSHKFKVYTKIPHLKSVSELKPFFLDSLKNLNRTSVDGVMFHSSHQLFEKDADLYWKSIEQLKAEGLCSKIGISLYSPEDGVILLERYPIDLVQLPFNIADQRLVRSSALKNLKKKNVEIHARSLFLQGLLLNTETCTSFFQPMKNYLKNFYETSQKANFSTLEMCILFAHLYPEVDYYVLGVDSVRQLEEILIAKNKIEQLKNENESLFESYRNDLLPWLGDEDMIMPSKWKLS